MMLNAATACLIVLSFGLGMGAVASQDLGTQFNGPNSDLHHKAGLGASALHCATVRGASEADNGAAAQEYSRSSLSRLRWV